LAQTSAKDLRASFLKIFPAIFVPRISLRGQLGSVGREKMQHDIVGDLEFVAVMIARIVHQQQDELPPVLLG
jgi:hypothetical protein